MNVIPSQDIVKSAAESNTAFAWADSSWDAKAGESKVEEGSSTENYDSGYSSSIGSNSTAIQEDRFSEKSEISPAAESASHPKCVDSVSDQRDGNEDVGETFYKHKKFFFHRKRENSSNSSDAPIPTKQPKLVSQVSVDNSVPSSSSPVIDSVTSCDSSVSDIKPIDTSTSPMGSVPDSVEKLKIASKVDVSSFQKDSRGLAMSEARHNLPFVWDRMTRSQRKTK